MPANILEELYWLHDAGVSLSIGHCWDITPEQALAFAEDPDAVYAELNGVTKEQWLAYRSEPIGGYVQCAATTKKGTRCSGIACYTHNAADWVAKQGSFCKTHQRIKTARQPEPLTGINSERNAGKMRNGH